MSEKNDVAAAPVAAKTAKPGGKTSGTIVYNRNLDAWRCINAGGKQVLSTGSKELAVKAYPDFLVKE